MDPLKRLMNVFAKYPVRFDSNSWYTEEERKENRKTYTSTNRNSLSEEDVESFLYYLSHSQKAFKYILPKAMEYCFDRDLYVLLERFIALEFQQWPQDERDAVLAYMRVRVKNLKRKKVYLPDDMTSDLLLEKIPDIALIVCDVLPRV